MFEKHDFLYSDRVFEIFLRINDELWDRIEKGTLTKTELHRIRWKIILEKLGIECDYGAFEQRFIETIITFAEPISGAKEVFLSEKIGFSKHKKEFLTVASVSFRDFCPVR